MCYYVIAGAKIRIGYWKNMAIKLQKRYKVVRIKNIIRIFATVQIFISKF